jgi:hypothetical protein
MFLFIHPSTLLMGLLAALTFLGENRWPKAPLTTTWAVVPSALNVLIWWYGLRLFGWQLGGLGGWMYVYLILPGNGLIFGLLSCPVLERIISKSRSAGLRAIAGFGIQLLVLILNLAVCSQFDQFIGNLSG